MTRIQLVAIIVGVALAMMLVLFLGRWTETHSSCSPDPELCRQLVELIEEHG